MTRMIQVTTLSEFREPIQKLLIELDRLQIDGSHWEGRLASSALSTATAVSALSLLRDGPIIFTTQQRIKPATKEVDNFDV